MVRAAVFASMALAVAGPLQGDAGSARGWAWVPQAPQVRLVITEREFFRRYDRVAVAVESEADGYLTVFRIDTDGRIRVLFPRDPRGENFVVAGRAYRIPNPYGQRGDHAFVVDDYPGVGYVFAVVSPEPFDYRPFVRNDHWEYRAVATSGDYRNFFESGGHRVHHVIDPRTGHSTDNGVVQVSVLAPDCTLADGLSTALMVVGPDAAAELLSREGMAGIEVRFLVRDADGAVVERRLP